MQIDSFHLPYSEQKRRIMNHVYTVEERVICYLTAQSIHLAQG